MGLDLIEDPGLHDQVEAHEIGGSSGATRVNRSRTSPAPPISWAST